MNVGDGLAMIVRADQGGIGIQSYEIWRHLRPSTTIVMRVDPPRGREDLSLYPGAVVTSPEWDLAARKATRRCRLVLSIEGTYGYPGPRTCAVIANPELWRPDYQHLIDRTAVHTTWEQLAVHPRPSLVPYPMPVDRIPYRVEHLGCWYHPAAPAMLDRNGTGVLLKALELCRVPHTVFIRSDEGTPWANGAPEHRIGRCHVVWLQERTDDYRDAYPAECGAMVLPRRYGGNCLPAYEAACMGWPVVMPDLAPQVEWPFVVTTKLGKARQRAMKGGRFAVWEPTPGSIAAEMDALAGDPVRFQNLGYVARGWAKAHAWEHVEQQWADWLT